MPDQRLNVECDYCGMKFGLRYRVDEDTSKPEYCCFCSETIDKLTKTKDDPEEEQEDDDIDEDFNSDEDA